MDPDTCLGLIDDCIRENDHIEAKLLCDILFGWLSKGGYKPDWDRFDRARIYYNIYVCEND